VLTAFTPSLSYEELKGSTRQKGCVAAEPLGGCRWQRRLPGDLVSNR